MYILLFLVQFVINLYTLHDFKHKSLFPLICYIVTSGHVVVYVVRWKCMTIVCNYVCMTPCMGCACRVMSVPSCVESLLWAHSLVLPASQSWPRNSRRLTWLEQEDGHLARRGSVEGETDTRNPIHAQVTQHTRTHMYPNITHVTQNTHKTQYIHTTRNIKWCLCFFIVQAMCYHLNWMQWTNFRYLQNSRNILNLNFVNDSKTCISCLSVS